MFRGNRLLIIAVGLATLGAGNSPKHPGTSEQEKTEQGEPQSAPAVFSHVETVEAVQSAEYQQPCEQHRDNRNSDLCAQWKAADAAFDAAQWAKWQFFLGIAGAVGLLMTIYYTRRAVLAAVASNKNAQDSLAHAKDMASVELRPYHHIDEIISQPAKGITGTDFVAIRIKNFGSTPAIDFRLEAGVEILNTAKNNFLRKITLRRYPSVNEIPPGHTAQIQIKGLPKGSYFGTGSAYFCTVKFYYSDKFGSEHMRWETYKAEASSTGSKEFRFFRHNDS